MIELILFISLVLIGLIFGRLNERRHFASLAKAEEELADIVAINIKTVPKDTVMNGQLVTGNVVVAVDYFKKIAASIKMLFGGNIRSYDSLMERARREAIIRMKQEARAIGATSVYNVRLQFSTTGDQARHSFGGVELFAYGTAVRHYD